MIWTQNAWNNIDHQDYSQHPLVSSSASNSSASNTQDTVFYLDGPAGFCSCLMFLRPNPATVDFLDLWAAELATGRHRHDQSAFDKVLRALGVSPETEEHRIPASRLTKAKGGRLVDDSASAKTTTTWNVRVEHDRERFPHGRMYFQDGTNSSNFPLQEYETSYNDKEKALIVHSNWNFGKDAKRQRFVEHGLWNLSGRVPTGQHLKLRCSLGSLWHLVQRATTRERRRW